MNNLMKQVASIMPIIALNQKADTLIATRPHGFKPVKKYVHGRKCANCLRAYDNYLTRRRDTRVIGNKKISVTTMNRIAALKKIAR